jgi:DNA mismatch repair protein MutH
MYNYDPQNKDSIIDFAKNLIDKSIKEEFNDLINKLNIKEKDKGKIGKVIEELYFNIKPNSRAEADFNKAGLELKSSGLKLLKNNEYRAKEKLVLNIINYLEMPNETFEKLFIYGKNSHLLLIFYHYLKGVDELSSKIKLVGDWKFPEIDLEIIKNDWNIIQNKIKEGKAHELSEGDTYYLAAGTKGGKGGNPRLQPNSNIKAKQRALVLKHNYVNHIIATIANEPDLKYGKLIKSLSDIKEKKIDDVVEQYFKKYLNKPLETIAKDLNIQINFSQKNHLQQVIKSIFKLEKDKDIQNGIDEFVKANIIVKTIKINKKNKIKENISFPAFKFKDIYNQIWEESDLKNTFEQKFLFIFFKEINNTIILDKYRIWNMPYKDRQEVRKTWLATKKTIINGNIFKKHKTNKKGIQILTKNGLPIREDNFPKASVFKICHVRPHGKNSNDTYELPVQDILSGLKSYTKQSFWLKNSYVFDEIYLKD